MSACATETAPPASVPSSPAAAIDVACVPTDLGALFDPAMANTLVEKARAFLTVPGVVYNATEDGCEPWTLAPNEQGASVWLPDEDDEDDEDGEVDELDDEAPRPCAFALVPSFGSTMGFDVATNESTRSPSATILELGCQMGDLSTNDLTHVSKDELRYTNGWLFRSEAACRRAIAVADFDGPWRCGTTEEAP